MAPLLAVASLLPSLPGEWVYDDRPYVAENRDLTGDVSRVARLFTVSFPSHAPERGLYRPVTALSYRLDRLVGPPDPTVSRVVNLALAAGLVLLVHALLRRVVSGEAALFGALLFASHPVHVESLVWVTGRAEILAALGGTAAFVLGHDVITGRGGVVRAVAAGVCLFAGVLSKESAAMFLPLLLLFVWPVPEVARSRRSGSLPRRRRLAFAIVPLAAALVAGLVLRWAALGAWGPAAGERAGPDALAERLPFLVAAAGEHLRLLVFPHPLSIERMTDPPTAWGDPRVVAGVLTLAGLAAIILGVQRLPSARALALWPLVALLPVLHLVPIGETVAERFLLVPSIGVVGLLGAGLAGGIGARLRSLRVTALVLLVGSGLVLRGAAARTWRTEESVWRAAIRHEPGSPTAWTGLGDSYAHRDWPDKAIPNYRHALELDGDLTVTRLALAQALDATGDHEGALRESSEAVQRAGDHPVALNNLGVYLARAGRLEEAEKMFRRAVALAPRYAPALRNAALAAAASGRDEEARTLARQARDADPAAPGLDEILRTGPSPR